MAMSIQLDFDGRCKQAFEFYQTHLNGHIDELFSYADTPLSSTVPVNWQDKIVHGSIQFKDLKLVGSDIQREQYQPPVGVCLLQNFDSEQAVRTAFEALSQEGQVIMAPCKTFFSPCYAVVKDKFSILWKLNSLS